MEHHSHDSGRGTVPARILRMIGNHPLRLLGANMLFLIACIPVVTIPAACCGLHSVVQRFYREIGTATVCGDFYREFKTDFLQRTGLCFLPMVVVMLVGGVAGLLLDSAIALVVSAILFLVSMIVLTWFVPQLVYLNLRPVQAMKNALIFTVIETKTNFFLMILHAVVLTVMVFFLPLSGFFLLVLPVLQTVLITGLVLPVLREKLAQDE